MQKEFILAKTGNYLEGVSAKSAVAIILGFSITACLFLFWLIYFNERGTAEMPWINNLSAVNASLNLLSTLFLLLGFREIKKGNYQKHLKFMLSAFITSALFLVSYIIYHHFTGDTKFLAEGFIRYIYFFVLISHIILSVFVVPLALLSFYLSLSGKFTLHKKVSRITFPVWLYVSVTGVLIFLMLKTFN